MEGAGAGGSEVPVGRVEGGSEEAEAFAYEMPGWLVAGAGAGGAGAASGSLARAGKAEGEGRGAGASGGGGAAMAGGSRGGVRASRV